MLDTVPIPHAPEEILLLPQAEVKTAKSETKNLLKYYLLVLRMKVHFGGIG